jgi:dCTP deaminase
MIFSDQTIIDKMGERIAPFEKRQVRRRDEGEDKVRIVSYGLSSSGYDVRLARELKVQRIGGKRNPKERFVDPKRGERAWEDIDTTGEEFVLIRPGECILGVTVEHVDMPDDVMALCIGKSTYARCGLLVNATPIEAGWRGHITLELSNTGRLPIRVYLEEGIAQLVFMQIDQRPNVTYNDRSGKYQDQENVPVTALI